MKGLLTKEKNISADALRETNEKLIALFEGSHDAIMLLSSLGFFDCNKRTLEIFGISTKEEFISYHPSQLSPPLQASGESSAEKAHEHILKAFQEGSNRFEWLHQKKNGEIFPAEVLLSAFDFGGERVLQATVRELSNEKKLLAQINQQKVFYSAIFNSIQEGCIVKNDAGKIIHCNEMATEILETTREELLEHGSDRIMQNAIREDGSILSLDQSPTMITMRTGRASKNITIGIQLKNQKYRWLRATAIPFKMEFEDERVSVLATYSDVTEEIEKRRRLSISESRLQEAQSVAKIGSWSFDLTTMVINWTPQLFELFPFPNKVEPSFEELCKVIHTEDLPTWKIAVDNCIQKGIPYNVRHRVVHPDKVLWMEAIGVPLRDSMGKIISIYGTCQDITERVQLEEENQFITSSLKLGIWKFNPVTNDLLWDKSMYSVFGVNEKDFSGSYDAWEKTLSPDSKEAAIKDLQLALTGEKEFDTTFKILTNIDEPRYIGGRAIVKRNPLGEPVMIYGVNWDKTKEMKLLESLDIEKAKSLHTAKLASLGEMSASIAHEINNPLAIITGHVAMMSSIKDQPEKFQAKVDLIQRAVERVSKIVNGLRKFSRSTQEKNYTEKSLTPIIHEAIVLAESKAKKHNIKISLDLRAEGKIYCDEVEIEQVLLNLINNSIDAIKDDVDRWLTISTFEDDGKVVLQAIDSGKGIAANVLARIFEPFYTTKPVGEGTGLGLSIVKGILDEHRASIQVKSDSANTCFEIKFRKLVQSNVA